MKILLTADYHIKLGQKNVPFEWAVNRFESLFEQIHSIDCDVHVVAGDIFDRLPSLDELKIFYKFVLGCNVDTYIIDGNHEATKKGSTFLDKLSEIAELLNPKVRIVTNIEEFDWGTLLPYCKLKQKGVFASLNKSKPLFTHVRGEIPPHVKPEIDLDLLSDFPVVYAGDLHSNSNTQRNIVYPGSPITTSFHRSLVSTGYILIEDQNWEWYKFDVPQLIRKTVTSEEEMVPTDYHHTIYEYEGNLAELSGVKNSDLLDKKIVKRSSEASLILTKDMSIEEELSELFLYIYELSEEETKEAIGVFRDNI